MVWQRTLTLLVVELDESELKCEVSRGSGSFGGTGGGEGRGKDR